MGNVEFADSSRYLARFAAFVALTVGLFVYAGWVFDLEQLTNLVPGWPRMSRLTALEFVLAAAGLWLATVDNRRLVIGCPKASFLEQVFEGAQGLLHFRVVLFPKALQRLVAAIEVIEQARQGAVLPLGIGSAARCRDRARP